jgi:hypothetical protein
MIIALNQAIYTIQTNLGIQPLWETKLIKTDYHLQTYKKWCRNPKMCTSACKALYHNRISYLKGWLR